MTLLGSLFPPACWLAYAFLSKIAEQFRPSLSTIMGRQRRRWVTNAVTRDHPVDAILASNLMGSISFFASTTMLLVLAIFAIFGQINVALPALNDLSNDWVMTQADFQIHLTAIGSMLVLAFLSFTLSLRQFNHFCIMLGAVDHVTREHPTEIAAIAELNSMGARNFNHGIRAYYFAIGSLAWFWHPMAAIVATLAIIFVLMYRDFFSHAHRLVAKLEHAHTFGETKND